MSREEGKIIRSFDYCLMRARLALEDTEIPELREEVFATAEEAKITPDRIWREAIRRLQEKRGKRATEDLNEEDEALARSYWWLAKTKRDHREEFEKAIKPEGKEMKKKKVRILFGAMSGVTAELDYLDAFRLCNEVLEGISESDAIDDFRNLPITTVGGCQRDRLRESLIEILEKFGLEPFIEVLEKNGIKVKICGNCRSCVESLGQFACLKSAGRSSTKMYHLGGTKVEFGEEPCERWAPKEKEVSDKISMKRYCSHCEKEVEIKIKRGDNPLEAKCPGCHREIRLRLGSGMQ